MTSPKAQGRIVLCIGMLLSNLIYLALAFYLEAKHQPQIGDLFVRLRIPLTLVAGGLLAAGAFLSLRLRPEQAPNRFQATMLVCLALMEACTVVGLMLFFLGLMAREFTIFVMVVIAAQALLVLPKALTYRDACQ